MAAQHKTVESPARQGEPALRIILAYSVLGPPIGWIIFFTLIVPLLIGANLLENGFGGATIIGVLQALAGFVGGFFLGAFVSYYYGFVPAFLTGCFLAALLKTFGRAGYPEALFAPLAIGFVAGLAGLYDATFAKNATVFLTFIGGVASLILRYCFHGLFTRR